MIGCCYPYARGLGLSLWVEDGSHPHRVLGVRLGKVDNGELVLHLVAHVLHPEVEPLNEQFQAQIVDPYVWMQYEQIAASWHNVSEPAFYSGAWAEI